MKSKLMGALALGFFGAVVGVGCGSDPEQGSPGDSNVEPIALDAYVDEFLKFSCDRTLDCCDAAELDEMFKGGSKPKNEAECVAQLSPVFDVLYGEQTKAVEEGRQGYDGKKAALCFSKLKGLCGTAISELDKDTDCATIFVGKVADGGACKEDADCSGADSSCYNEACRARGAVGQECTFADDCLNGYCDESFACAAKKADGEACTKDTECKSDSCEEGKSVCVPAEADTTCDGK